MHTATICPLAIKQVGGSLFGGGRLMPGQQWPEMHTDPYHPWTHTSFALTPPATSDVTVTASRCPICHFEALWEWCMLPRATLFFFFSMNPAKMIRKKVCKRCEIHLALFNIKGLESAVPLFSWLTRVQSVTPLQPFTSAAFRGGLWMAMPWIYTWNLTIIHPRSFQIDSLLKVNCPS